MNGETISSFFFGNFFVGKFLSEDSWKLDDFVGGLRSQACTVCSF